MSFSGSDLFYFQGEQRDSLGRTSDKFWQQGSGGKKSSLNYTFRPLHAKFENRYWDWTTLMFFSLYGNHPLHRVGNWPECDFMSSPKRPTGKCRPRARLISICGGGQSDHVSSPVSIFRASSATLLGAQATNFGGKGAEEKIPSICNMYVIETF